MASLTQLTITMTLNSVICMVNTKGKMLSPQCVQKQVLVPQFMVYSHALGHNKSSLEKPNFGHLFFG